MTDMSEVFLYLTVILWLPAGWCGAAIYAAYELGEHEDAVWEDFRALRLVLFVFGWGGFFGALLVAGINSDCRHGMVFRKPRD